MKTKPRKLPLAATRSVLSLVLLPMVALTAPDTPNADSLSAQAFRFTFGTPHSVTRRGFTKVTVEDVFTSAKGYGLQKAQGLL